MASSGQKKRYDGFERRVHLVSLGLVAAFAMLVLRLWFLQIVHWYDYAQLAECNRLHPQRLEAPRGMIYGPDSSVVLADNRPSCDLMIIPAECGPDKVEIVCRRLEELVGVEAEGLLQRIEQNKAQPYRQVLVKKDVPRSDITRVEEFSYLLPGIYTVARPQRRYAYGKTAGQILGYMGEIGPEELEQMEQYKLGDLIGRDGIESVYETALRGTDGKLVVNVYRRDRRPQLRTDAYGKPYVAMDSYGRKLKEEVEFRKDPVPGQSIFTTLDIDLQQYGEHLLKDQVGAIAVLDADTGAILALASSPGYDPSVFVTHGRSRERIETLTDKPNPMLNRCFRETYAPGSTFKVLLVSAALEEGVIDENTTFFCPGHFRLEGSKHIWHCWKRYGHGTMGVEDAIAHSCDVFFYNVGLRLGVDKIKEWSAKIGLGEKTGIDLPHEAQGLIPSREWKEAQMRPRYPDQPWNWRWYPGNTVNLAIGQGEAATTPLQNAVMMAAIVNGGRRVRPYLNTALDPEASDPFISERTLAIVRAGLAKVVEEGTGKAAKIPGMTVLGKTGSAQMVSLAKHDAYENEEDIPYELRDHAWFVAGVMDREPRIALCVLVEHGHHGSSVAAPLAKLAIEHFYASRPPPEEMHLADGRRGAAEDKARGVTAARSHTE